MSNQYRYLFHQDFPFSILIYEVSNYLDYYAIRLKLMIPKSLRYLLLILSFYTNYLFRTYPNNFCHEKTMLHTVLIDKSSFNQPNKIRFRRIITCKHPASGYGCCAIHIKRCRIERCMKRTPSRGLCFRHGGGQRCKVHG